MNSKMERKRLSLKSRRRVRQSYRPGGERRSEETKRRIEGPKQRGRTGGKGQMGKERKGQNRGQRGRGSLQVLLSSAAAEMGRCGAFEGAKVSALMGKRSWGVQVPALLPWPSPLRGVRDPRGLLCVASAPLGAMLRRSRRLSPPLLIY